MSDFTISGVYDLPTHRASAAFTSKTSEVFKEDDNIAPSSSMSGCNTSGGGNMMASTIIAILLPNPQN